MKAEAENLLRTFRYYQKARDEFNDAMDAVRSGKLVRLVYETGINPRALPHTERAVEDAILKFIEECN